MKITKTVLFTAIVSIGYLVLPLQSIYTFWSLIIFGCFAYAYKVMLKILHHLDEGYEYCYAECKYVPTVSYHDPALQALRDQMILADTVGAAIFLWIVSACLMPPILHPVQSLWVLGVGSPTVGWPTGSFLLRKICPRVNWRLDWPVFWMLWTFATVIFSFFLVAWHAS